jgi:type II secretory pathway component PulF
MGPVWHWSGLMEWSSLMGVLIRYQVPLPLALRLAAEGVSNPNVGQISMSLAEGVARGRSLAEAMSDRREVPASLVPLVRWGETMGNLAEALGAGREMLQERVHSRSLWMRMALPPVLFIVIGSCVLFVVLALFMPLIMLIQKLS